MNNQEDHEWGSGLPKSILKGGKNRHAHVRTPSEESLEVFDGVRCAPSPSALARPCPCPCPRRHSCGAEDNKSARKKRPASRPDLIPAASPPTGPLVSGNSNPSSNPGSNPAYGINNLLAANNTNANVTNGFQSVPPQAFATLDHLATAQPSPQYQQVQIAGQPGLYYIIPAAASNMASNMAEGNYVLGNHSVHFQPQVPDSSLGPIMQEHTPNPKSGHQVYMVPAAGGFVCPRQFFSHSLTPSPYPALILANQAPQPLTYFQQPLLVTAQSAYMAQFHAMAPIATMQPAFHASAVNYTTMGYSGRDGIVAPREVIVVRISCHLLL